MTIKQKITFAAILLLAVFFRYYLITQMPGGLFPDEAADGLDVGLMQQGHLQPFYARANGREALFIYLEWGSAALFGKGPWQMHIVSGLVGVLSVLMAYFVTYRLVMFGENFGDLRKKNRAVHIALLAMFFMAVSTWHVVLSRTAFRAILIPLFASLTLYFLLRSIQSQTTKTRGWFALLTGAAFAGGFYTYIAFRIMPAILFVIILWPWLASIKLKQFSVTTKQWVVPFILAAIGFGAVIFPLAKYFYDNPGSFIGRASQVSVFNQTLYTVNGQQLTGKPPFSIVFDVVATVAKTQVEGLFMHGDLNWRQNISGFPLLSPLLSPFFGVGLIVITILGIWYLFAPNKRFGWWKYLIIAIWFWAMLLPAVTTAEGIPHGLRGIGDIPSVFIISAIAVYTFAGWVVKLHHRIWNYAQDRYEQNNTAGWKWSGRGRIVILNLFKVVVACFCLGLIIQTYFLYFVYAYNDATNFYSFRSDLTPVSQYLVTRCSQSQANQGTSTKNSTFLVLDAYSVQTVDYLTSNRYGNTNDICADPYVDVDPASSWQLPPLQTGQAVVFTQSTMFDTKKFKQYHPEAYLHEEVRDKFGEDVLAVYEAHE